MTRTRLGPVLAEADLDEQPASDPLAPKPDFTLDQRAGGYAGTRRLTQEARRKCEAKRFPRTATQASSAGPRHGGVMTSSGHQHKQTPDCILIAKRPPSVKDRKTAPIV